MPYVMHNKNGRMSGFFDDYPGTASVRLNLSYPDVKESLAAVKVQLASSGTETIRVIEDLIYPLT